MYCTATKHARKVAGSRFVVQESFGFGKDISLTYGCPGLNGLLRLGRAHSESC